MPRLQLENFFSYRKTILTVVIIITLVLGFGLTKLKFDVSFDYAKDSVIPTVLEQGFQQEEKSALSPSNSSITVILHDNDLFSLNKLHMARELMLQLVNNRFVSHIDSLFSMPDLQYYFKTDEWRPLVTGNEETIENLDYVRHQATQNRLLVSRFLNSQETTLALYVALNSTSQKESYLARNSIQKILDQYKADFSVAYQMGEVEANYYSYHSIIFNLKTIGPLSLLALMLIYSVLFKRTIMGFLPFVSSSLALVWAGGIVAYIGVPINSLICVVIILVFTIGAMECAHFINCYQRYHKKNPGLSAAALSAMTTRHVFWPIFFATVTTVLGFLFNIFTSVKLLEDFAISICLAISINAFIICTVLPLIIGFSIDRSSKQKATRKTIFSRLTAVMIKFHQVIIMRPVFFISILVFIVLGGIFFAPKIPVEIVSYVNFYQSSALMRKVFDTQRYLSGTRSLSIYFGSTTPQGFKEKENLDTLLAIENKVSELPETFSTLSIASLTASVYELFMGSDSGEDEYIVPDSWYFNNAVSTFSTQINALSGLTARDSGAAKILINYQIFNTQELSEYMENIRNIIKNNLKGSSLTYEFSYEESAKVLSVKKVMQAQMISILIIYLIIFLVMWGAFKKLKAGIVAIIPNVFPLAGVFLFMYVFNIPFFPLTIIVLAAVVGLAVDDTIHIMLSFRKHFRLSQDLDQSIYDAMNDQMRPVTIASVSLILGFGMMIFSTEKGVMLFAVVMCFGAFLSWISDMLVTPFLLKKINIYDKL